MKGLALIALWAVRKRRWLTKYERLIAAENPRVWLLSVLLLALLTPATAHASTIIAGRGDLQPLFQQWTDESLAPTPRGYITIAFDQTDEGETHVNPWEPRLIHWWEKGVGVPDGAERLNFYIELGNVFQFTRGPRKERLLKVHFAAIMRPGRDWTWAKVNWPNFWDWFGMAYSSCAGGVPIPNAYFWGFDYEPSEAQQAKACNLIQRVGGKQSFYYRAA